MKKFLALLLSALMVLCLVPAMAETAEDVIEIETVENGTWVPFTDYNIQICLPSDWNVMELTEEQTATGVFFSTQNPEGTRVCTLAYSEMEQATDIETVANALAQSYANVSLININGMDFVTYDIAENDVSCLATLGGAGIGLYQFVFGPASDAEYGPIAMQIAASISAIE